MTNDEIDALWERYKDGPDYFNVKRWFETPTLTNTQGHMKWLFRSAILCATRPEFLEKTASPDDASIDAEGE